VVKANEIALTNGENKIYNIGTGIENNVNELFKRIVEFTGKEVPEKHGPAQPGEQLRSVLNSELIYKELGWKPEIQLEEGLQKTVRFFKKKLGSSLTVVTS